MHPVSTALFLLGYGLALPIALQMSRIVAQQHRLAFVGHQVGVTIALVGWAIRGTITIALIHVLWVIGVRVWFHLGRPETTPTSTGSAG